MTTNTPARQEPPKAQPVVLSPSQQGLAQVLVNNPLLPRIHMAMMFPRDMVTFPAQLREAVLRTPEGMVYKKPQGREKILGPSIRMAEVAARCFKNLWVSEPKIEERDNRVTVTVEALDLESNLSVPGTATTSLVGQDKRRMREDIVSNLVNATVAKAKRNAIIGVIGKTFFDDLVAPCMKAEADRAEADLKREKGEGKPGDKWQRCVAAWASKGITEAELLKLCKAESPAAVTPAQYADLGAAWTACAREGVAARVALGLEDDGPPPTDEPPDPEEMFRDDRE